jgi:hypothetical protein
MSFWKRVFRFGAAIAIPYVAPALGASLNTLTGLGAFMTGAGQIGLGAGLGALGAQATGGDWRTGAAIGAGGVAAQRAELLKPLERTVGQMFGGGAGTAAPLVRTAGVAPEAIYGAGAGAVAPATTTAAPGVLAALGGRLSDPNVMADMTLRAAGMLAGSALAGSGLSPEEERLLAAQTEELRQLQQTNQQLFQQRLQQAQDLAGEAKYFDPNYFGLQSARRTQTAMGQEAARQQRGLTGERLAAERRRAGLATARATGTAYDTGFQQGIQGQMQARRAGIEAFPKEGPSSMGAYSQLANAYSGAANRQRQAQADIGGLFADVFSRDQDKNQPKPKA